MAVMRWIKHDLENRTTHLTRVSKAIPPHQQQTDIFRNLQHISRCFAAAAMREVPADDEEKSDGHRAIGTAVAFES